MKYLRVLTVRPRLTIMNTFILIIMMGLTAPAYAMGTVSGFGNVITCSGGPSFATTTTGAHNGGGEKCLVESYIDPLVAVMSGLVAVFVVLSIIIAGIQYSGAADDSSKVSAAKARIQKALLALLAYIFLLAFLKYILPGGLQQ